MNRRQLLQLCFGLIAGLPFLSLSRGPRLKKWSEHLIYDFWGKTTHIVSGRYTKPGLWIDEASFYQREIEKLVKVPIGFERSIRQYRLINHGVVEFTFTDKATRDHKNDLLAEYLRKPRLVVAQRTS